MGACADAANTHSAKLRIFTPREELPEPSATQRTLDDVLADQDLVRQLIARAPAQQAAAAWLHYVDGIPQGEVGRILGISRRTVIHRLSFARPDGK